MIEAITFNGAAVPVTNKTANITASIPSESTVSGWGFTKNEGTYSKPSGGIPATDLDSAVQTSLGKADTALQSFTESDPIFVASAAYGISSSDITNWNSKTSNVGTITGITMNGSSKGTSGIVDLGTVLTSYTETDPTVPAWAKASAKPTYTASEVGALPDTTVIPTESTVSGWGFTKNTGTLTGVTFNGTSATINNGVAAITATIPTVPTNVSAFTNDANYVSSDNTVTVYSGSSAPSSNMGSNGDIYIQTTS